MNETDIWMLGVGAFGVVFYLFSLYYGRSNRKQSMSKAVEDE